MKKIVLPDSLIRLGYTTENSRGVFDYCLNLESIILGKNVKFIALNAFYMCTNLESIYYKGTDEDWNRNELAVLSEFTYTSGTSLADKEIPTVIYYYSESGKGINGQYWHYSKTDGICISSTDTLIDTKYFKLFADGEINAEKATIEGDVSAENIVAKRASVDDIWIKNTSVVDGENILSGITAEIPYYKTASTTGILKFVNGILVQYT